MTRVLMAGAMLLMLEGPASAAVIASLAGDFSPVTFPAGWQYLRNAGPIGVSATYVPLLWDATNNFYDVSGSAFPDPGPPLDYTLRAPTFAHPGPGVTQGVPFDHYLVVAYTIQTGEAGSIDLVNGSLAGLDASGPSNGWDILTFVGNTQVGSALSFPWSLAPAAFSRPFGYLNTGDTVYVALGPNGSHLYDAAAFDFTLTSTPVPEPASAALGIGLAVALGLRRRSSRRQ